MPSHLTASSVSAVMLAALLLCARGASLGNATADSTVGDFSGEQEGEQAAEQAAEQGDQLENAFSSAIESVTSLRNDIPAEIQKTQQPVDLRECISLAAECPFDNFSKEACLQRLVHGLQTYIILLMFVESELHSNRGTKSHVENLNKLLKNEMRNHQPPAIELKELTNEKQLLNKINVCYKDAFNRKSAANQALKELYNFLTRGKRVVINGKTPRARRVKSTPTVHPYNQLLNRLT